VGGGVAGACGAGDGLALFVRVLFGGGVCGLGGLRGGRAWGGVGGWAGWGWCGGAVGAVRGWLVRGGVWAVMGWWRRGVLSLGGSELVGGFWLGLFGCGVWSGGFRASCENRLRGTPWGRRLHAVEEEKRDVPLGVERHVSGFLLGGVSLSLGVWSCGVVCVWFAGGVVPRCG